MFYRFITSAIALVLGGMITAAEAEESVTLRLKWFHQAQFAGFYVAKDKELYKAAGLNVDIQTGRLVKLLVFGDVEAGKLRLMKPFQPQRHRFLGLGGGDHSSQDQCDGGRDETVEHERCPPQD